MCYRCRARVQRAEIYLISENISNFLRFYHQNSIWKEHEETKLANANANAKVSQKAPGAGFLPVLIP